MATTKKGGVSTWFRTDATPPKPPEPTQFYLSIQPIGSAEPTIYVLPEPELTAFFKQFSDNWADDKPVVMTFGESGGMYHPRSINMTWEKVQDAKS